MKKRIIHIISSLKRGGAESLLVDLLAELKQFEHHVIYFHDGPNRQRLENMGIKTYQIKGLICSYDPIFFIRLWRRVKILKPDCIHSALWVANFAGRLIAKLQNIPLISVLHLGVHQDGKLRNLIDRMTFRFSQNVIAVSDEVANSLKKHSWIPAQKVTTITNGISSERIQAEAHKEQLSRKDLKIGQDTFIIGCVGRFIPRKNFPLLIKTFAEVVQEVENVALILVGFGPQEEELKNLVQKLNLSDKVHFIVGRSAYSCYSLFDCFVLPSFQEGMSIALLEAMCFSLPCIVTSPTTKHEVICSGKNGYIVPSNDKKALREHLFVLMQDEVMRKKLGKQALESINNNFNIATMADNYDQLFRELIRL